MEAVPKLPMLSFDYKVSTDNGDFADTIRALIRDRYHENPGDFQAEVAELETLRANACIRPVVDNSGTETIKKYYCQLHYLKKRFNIQPGYFNFSWYDCYLGVICSYSDFEYEMASVLYNAGAVHSQLGAKERRDSSEEMKVACTHFQCAAWVFHTLPDRYPRQMGSDLSVDLLAFLSQVCLAQAQECILEKSILDHRKASIIAKVCAQVAEYYKAAHKKIETSNNRNDDEPISESVGEKKSKMWTKYMEFKSQFFSAIAYFYMALQAEEDQHMGLRLAYCQAASDFLGKATKLGKNMDYVDKSLIANCLNFTSDVINGKLDNAKKENEFVYHDKVPDFDSLPELKGASLVKGLGFEVTNPDISGPDIFAKLVPMSAHEASSLYSEEKAKLLRSIGSEIETKDDDLNAFLSTLLLDEIPQPGDEVALPQELIECAAGLSVKGDPIQQLKEAMARIASVSSDVESTIREIEQMLENEKEEEKSFQAICGKRNPPSDKDDEDELKKYSEAHKMASESNASLHKAIQLHLDNLTLLDKSLEDLQKAIPSMEDLDETSVARIAEVRRLLAKVDEMKTQRMALSEKLRNAVHEDDITKKLIAAEGNEDMQSIFDEELKKFDGDIKFIRQNLLAQDNILKALTESNADFAETRRQVATLISERRSKIDQLISSYHAYEDLLLKAAKGLEFYDKLDSNVTRLLNKIKSNIEKRQNERDAKIAAKASSNPMFSTGGSLTMMPPTGFSSSPHIIPSMRSGGSGTTEPPKPERLTLRQVLEQRKLDKSSLNPQSSNPASPGQSNNALFSSPHSYTPQAPPPEDPNAEVKQEMKSLPQSFDMKFNNPTSFPSSRTSMMPNLQGGNHMATAGPDVRPPLPNSSQSSHSFQMPLPSVPMASGSHGSVPASTNQNMQSRMGYYAAPAPTPGSPFSPQQNSVDPQHKGQVKPQNFHPTSAAPQFSQQQVSHATRLPYQPHQNMPSSQFLRNSHPHQYQQPVSQGTQAAQLSKTPSQPVNQIPFQQYHSHNQQVFSQYQQIQPPLMQQQPQPQLQHRMQMPEQFLSQQNQSFMMNQQGPQRYQHFSAHPSSDSNSVKQFQPNGASQQNQVRPEIPKDTPHSLPPLGASTMTSSAIEEPVVHSRATNLSHPQQSLYGNTSFPSYHQPSNNAIRPMMSSGVINSSFAPQVQTPYRPQQLGGPLNNGYNAQNPRAQTPLNVSSSAQPPPHISPSPQHPYNSSSGNAYLQQSQSNRFSMAAQPHTPQQMSVNSSLAAQNQFASYQQMQARPMVPQPGSVGQQMPTLQSVVPQPGTLPPPASIQNASSKVNLDQNQPQPTSNVDAKEVGQKADETQTHKRQSSVDILSELDQSAFKPPEVLQPKVLTAEEIEAQKKEAQVSADLAKVSNKDPYSDNDSREKLLKEFRELESTIASFSLDKNALEQTWKRMINLVDQEPKYGNAISVARCYPMKNRLQDVLPYDKTRVELPTTKDDYINASHVKSLSKHSPKFIATQSPAPNTFNDFWTMVWQEQVETVLCLLSEADLKDVYWPQDRKEPLKCGKLEIALQGVKKENGCIERTFTVKDTQTNVSKVTLHLQLSDYSLENMVKVLKKTIEYYRQQRNVIHPVLVHCLGGSGKTAQALIILAAISEIDVGKITDDQESIVPDLVYIAAQICKQRRGVLKDREHLKQSFEGVRKYCKDVLVKHGVLQPEPQVAKKSLTVGTPTIESRPKSAMSTDLSKLSDLSLNDAPDGGKNSTPHKITKQDFSKSSKKKEKQIDPNDPLSQLDPFWSLK